MLEKQSQLAGILDIMRLAEKLKLELRHSWLSNGRRESVAEHTWRMSLFAVLVEPLLDQKVDMPRMLKMIIIHDLVEAEAGDVSVLDQIRNPEIKIAKQEREQRAIENIREKLILTNGREIYDLFQEFEAKHTYEAKVANALDKLEVQLQHNHADISTWEEIEYELAFLLGKHVDFDSSLSRIKDLIEEEAETKLENAGVDVKAIKTSSVRYK